jgi:hypothetical protein
MLEPLNCPRPLVIIVPNLCASFICAGSWQQDVTPPRIRSRKIGHKNDPNFER